ncbi:hypothetical protein VLK31_32735 [Variovorax sp. H27-G14]|uniref:hypothetical protein n=1 Tax=Variovorax sp. H27-G14 TaxID=3111914 RepID=UPI0038FD2C71
MNKGEEKNGVIHNPGIVAAEDPATGEPDPSVLKEVSEQVSRANEAPAKALDADTERRRARLADTRPRDGAVTQWQKR